ncbi:MAG: hypothetical protein ACK5LC_15600 [Coprobacillaceae bacterium]
MKKVKLALIAFICTMFIVPINTVNAEGNEIIEEEVFQFEEPVFIEQTKEEFVSDIAEINSITYEEALARVDAEDAKGISEAVARGERLPRALKLYYGYFRGTKTESANLFLSIGITYGVYASYYLPTGSTSWSSRKYNKIHDVFVNAATGSTVLSVEHKAANITSQYRIQFDATYLIKSNVPFQSYNRRSVRTYFDL